MSNSKPKHTLAPWTIETYHGSLFKICKPDFKIGDEVTHRLEADARLIAAAPELLEALEIAVAQLDRDGHDLSKLGFLKQTIAKARGES